MSFHPSYRTGEHILPGDKVRHGPWEGTVDFVITQDSPGWDTSWKQLGEGVMLNGPAFGSLYTKFDDEDLIFVARKEGKEC